VFSLTACSTVLAGLALSYPKLQGTLNMVILLVTAAIGVLTSIEGLRKPGELWIHERTTHYALKDLKRDLEYRTAELEQRVVLDDFFLRLQAILGAAGEKWDRNIVRGTAQNVQPGAAGATPERARS
jgi:hypothetical protein